MMSKRFGNGSSMAIAVTLKHGKDFHVGCPFKTKSSCEQAQREKLGRCVALTGDADAKRSKQEPKRCSDWAVDRVDGFGYCRTHLTKMALAADDLKRSVARKQKMDEAADRFIAWRATHPSVWNDPRTT